MAKIIIFCFFCFSSKFVLAALIHSENYAGHSYLDCINSEYEWTNFTNTYRQERDYYNFTNSTEIGNSGGIVSSNARCRTIFTDGLTGQTETWFDAKASSIVSSLDLGVKMQAEARNNLFGNYSVVAWSRNIINELFYFEQSDSNATLYLDFNIEGNILGSGSYSNDLQYGTTTIPQIVEQINYNTPGGIYERFRYEIPIYSQDYYFSFFSTQAVSAFASSTPSYSKASFSNSSWVNISMSDGRQIFSDNLLALSEPRDNIQINTVSAPPIIYLFGLSIMLLVTFRANRLDFL